MSLKFLTQTHVAFYLLNNSGTPKIFFYWGLFVHVREVSLNVCISPQWLISEFQLAEEFKTSQLPGACCLICIKVISTSPNTFTHAHARIHAPAFWWSIKHSRVCFDRILICFVNSGFISEGSRQTKFSCSTIVPVCRQCSEAATRSDLQQTITKNSHNISWFFFQCFMF